MRTHQEMEKTFRVVERELDDLLGEATPALAALGLDVRDESDRRGRDWYRWEHLFDWTRRDGQIRRVGVRVSYSETLERQAVPLVELGSRVEVFRLGQPSDFVHDTSRTLGLDDLSASGLCKVVQRAIHEGLQVLDRGPDPDVAAAQALAEAVSLRADDWEFYSKLGRERPAVPCRKVGCSRGAIPLSVFCQAHHFEQIMGRPCPFESNTPGAA